jgi:hypothetical protein
VHHAASQAEKKSVILSKPPTPKPNPKLEAAAKGSSKLDAWTGKAQENTVSAAPKSKKFCLARHERDFDQFQHGYLRKNGIDMYRFPDGTEVKVFSNVNEMTEDGLLRCADTTKEEEVAPPAANEPMQATKESQLKKPPPKKSNPKLETAAKGSSRLDAWLGARK